LSKKIEKPIVEKESKGGAILMRFVSIIICLISIMVLSACKSGPIPEEQIYVHLEQAVKLEAEFENQQDPIVSLEQKEKEIYNQIIALGLKEMDQIKQLSSEALTIVDERNSRLDQEYESIKQSKNEFDKITELIDTIESEESRDLADALMSLMTERYLSYEKLYTAYSTSITLDQELYSMFQKEDLTLEELEAQIDLINKSYEQVISLNDTFNKLTTDYNDTKKSFYEAAGIEVTYENE
jgi:prefoldin subunit 5